MNYSNPDVRFEEDDEDGNNSKAKGDVEEGSKNGVESCGIVVWVWQNEIDGLLELIEAEAVGR